MTKQRQPVAELANAGRRPRTRRCWDIFCSVVDNFGDIGFCWRLARRLTTGLGQDVRLWVDDLGSFKRLRPGVDTERAEQNIDGVEVCHWTSQFPVVRPAQIVIEGFGVRLPDQYIEAMAVMHPAPVWINLEYLSAEAWVDEHHTLPSPHPRLPLTKYFFFPGFTAATGGVLIEDGLTAAREAMQADAVAVQAFRRALGCDADDDGRLWVSLFCYENAALPALVSAWADDVRGVHCVVPEGYALAQLEKILARSVPVGTRVEHRHLTLHAVHFLDPDQYDRLLWSCDMNFVRGEESFVRAQLAARPVIWQAYPQEATVHLDKALAFRQRYSAALGEAEAQAYAALYDAWNRQDPACAAAWPRFAARLDSIRANAAAWSGRLLQNGDLALNLDKFCEDRLE